MKQYRQARVPILRIRVIGQLAAACLGASNRSTIQHMISFLPPFPFSTCGDICSPSFHIPVFWSPAQETAGGICARFAYICD
jgi:hypothetical protein